MKIIHKFRLWLIKKLFTDDEKYLIIRAIDDRVSNLERIAVTEKWADKDQIQNDCLDYKKLREIFPVYDYK